MFLAELGDPVAAHCPAMDQGQFVVIERVCERLVMSVAMDMGSVKFAV